MGSRSRAYRSTHLPTAPACLRAALPLTGLPCCFLHPAMHFRLALASDGPLLLRDALSCRFLSVSVDIPAWLCVRFVIWPFTRLKLPLLVLGDNWVKATSIYCHTGGGISGGKRHNHGSYLSLSTPQNRERHHMPGLLPVRITRSVQNLRRRGVSTVSDRPFSSQMQSSEYSVHNRAPQTNSPADPLLEELAIYDNCPLDCDWVNPVHDIK